MNRNVIALCAAAGALCAGTVLAAGPFRLPLGAVVTETTADGKGWLMTGRIGLTYVSARMRFASALAASGWSHRHSIDLGSANDRVLEVWGRGRDELSLMMWRIDVDRTGFSWGLSKEVGK